MASATSSSIVLRLPPLLCLVVMLCFSSCYQPVRVAATEVLAPPPQDHLTLTLVRQFLAEQEDIIVSDIVARAAHPSNPSMYSGGPNSLLKLFVKTNEEAQAKAGRYQNPEELPFFPSVLSGQPSPSRKFPQPLYPRAASVNVSDTIWKVYTENLLPLFTLKGDDRNYNATAETDLACLQVISRRIHYGRYVAEVKFRDHPNDYIPAIRAKDKKTLMTLLTDAKVEETVKRRVEKKAIEYQQNVNKDHNNLNTHKVNPRFFAQLYEQWIMPLTKVVEVEYFLNRLD